MRLVEPLHRDIVTSLDAYFVLEGKEDAPGHYIGTDPSGYVCDKSQPLWQGRPPGGRFVAEVKRKCASKYEAVPGGKGGAKGAPPKTSRMYGGTIRRRDLRDKRGVLDVFVPLHSLAFICAVMRSRVLRRSIHAATRCCEKYRQQDGHRLPDFPRDFSPNIFSS